MSTDVTSIEYPIETETREGRYVIIKAGKSWTDKQHVLQYEGIMLKIPSEVRTEKPLVFAVIIASRKDEQSFLLRLHAHSMLYPEDFGPYDIPSPEEEFFGIDPGGDVEVSLVILRTLLKKWTGLTGRDLNAVFRTNPCTLAICITFLHVCRAR